ncbi:MAG: hypothetical protein QT08_C0008G0028 [archaeon GW2011_AR17]|nr:MAG: hypothetical protein QT08_C0008G0028 [archaeon GW2011_AR17]
MLLDKMTKIFDLHAILNMEALLSHRGKVIKYSRDAGENWRYVQLERIPSLFFGEQRLFFHTEMVPQIEDRYACITEKDFERERFIARIALYDECEGKQFLPRINGIKRDFFFP